MPSRILHHRADRTARSFVRSYGPVSVGTTARCFFATKTGIDEKDPLNQLPSMVGKKAHFAPNVGGACDGF